MSGNNISHLCPKVHRKLPQLSIKKKSKTSIASENSLKVIFLFQIFNLSLRFFRESSRNLEVKEFRTLPHITLTNYRTLSQFALTPILLIVKLSPIVGTDLSRKTWLVRTQISWSLPPSSNSHSTVYTLGWLELSDQNKVTLSVCLSSKSWFQINSKQEKMAPP